LLDGLDGSVARLTQPTDAGGFLDIALDFVFYAAIPLAFAVANPATNALPAAALLASFIGTGSSFLAFAALAEKRGLTDTALPGKSFYFLGGSHRSHRNHHRVCRHVHLARTLCGVGLWVCGLVCHHHGDAGWVGVLAVRLRLSKWFKHDITLLVMHLSQEQHL
jgi:hypothetical protein